MEWLLWLAIAATIGSLFIRLENFKPSRRKQLRYSLSVLQFLPFIVLTTLFVSDSIEYDLVRLYGGSEMPLLYRISAVWAGREGPTLLWAGLLAITAAFFHPKIRETSEERGFADLNYKMTNGAVLTLLITALMMDPFRTAQSSWRGELNPLLQTDLMVLHPPLVYLYYSLCMVVAIQALAFTLSTTQKSSWAAMRDAVTPAARTAFATGTVGIGLGGLWAYTILDWGGYWAWDPVETASLLPWVSLLLLLHLRVTPGKQYERFLLPLAVLPGWFSIHATMVTRANGVWASVHAFVGEDMGVQSSSAILRILELNGSGMGGTEVLSYLLMLVLILVLLISQIIVRQSNYEDLGDFNRLSIWSLLLVLVLPVSRLISINLFGSETSLAEQIPIIFWLSLCLIPMVGLFSTKLVFQEVLIAKKSGLFTLIILVGAGLFSDEPVVAVILFLVMLLKVSSRTENDTVWTVTGVVVVLTSVYAYLIDIKLAGVYLLLFIWPLLVRDVEDDEDGIKVKISKFFTRSFQLRIALYAPVVLGGIFLALTWMLMLASVDGTSLAMHEMFGAPILLLMASALAVYAWKDSLNEKFVPYFLIGAIIFGIVIGSIVGVELMGDSDGEFSTIVNRGEVAWLVLPTLIIAIPSIIRLSFSRLKLAYQRPTREKIRGALAHLAHFGILVLLVGHLFTTTLVDRGDAAHSVVLVQGEEISHEGHTLIFTEWETLTPGDSEFDERFSVGDRYLGAVIEMRDDEGKLVDTIHPGMLQFDGSNNFPRSEVDRYIGMTGDVVFIFDWSQTQALGNISQIMNPDDGESGLDRVRLTVYNLPVSHLVWAGWLMIILSSFGIAATSVMKPKS